MDRTRAARRTRFGMAVLLAVIALACFVRVLELGFVYDDHWTVVDNPALERPLSSLLRACVFADETTKAIADSSRPTMLASVWVDRRLFGMRPAGYHAHSLVWYALGCAGAGLLLLAMTRRVRIAVAGGAFFAVAPAHAEAVAAINYREDLIAGLVAIGVLTWIFSSRARPETSRGAAIAAVAWLIGLLAKESAVAVVAVTAGLVALRRPDREWVAQRKRSGVALSLVLVLWGAWRLSLRVRGVDNVPLAESAGSLSRVLAAARYEVEVLLASLAPVSWSPEYDPQGAASPWWLLALIVAVAMTVAFAIRRPTRPVGLGLAFALLAALPTSPLVGPANVRADRYVFLSVLGGAFVWGWLAERAVLALGRRLGPGSWPAAQWSALALLLPVVSPMVAVTQRAALAWKSDLSLWSVASVRAPGSYRSWVGLSRALRLSGDLAGAEASVERALRIHPTSLSAHVTRAYARLARGDVDGARADIQRVRELGGARQRGLEHAARCAELTPDKTRECIDGKR